MMEVDPTVLSLKGDAYLPSLIQSATRSPIMIVLVLVLARITSGITEASTTRSPSRPWTWQNWSTTAIVPDGGPILQVPDLPLTAIGLANEHAV